MDVSTCRLSPVLALPGIRSLRWRGKPRWPPQPLQCSTPESDTRGTTSIVFGENQLFPDLFSLSPLATAHPLPFQREWVRPSTRCYPRFSLAMARSSGFGSTQRKSLTHYTKGTQSPQLNRSSVLRSGSASSHGSFAALTCVKEPSLKAD